MFNMASGVHIFNRSFRDGALAYSIISSPAKIPHMLE